MQVQSLGLEDPLEEEMATHSNTLALENSMDREAWQATVHGVARSQTLLKQLKRTHTDTHTISFQKNSLNKNQFLEC